MEDRRRGLRRRVLPPSLPEACAALVVELRELKDSSGLTLAELAESTAISKSSWERYLNGKQFPPRHAVEALCRAAPNPGPGILDRWARADAAWSGRGQSVVRTTGTSVSSAVDAPDATVPRRPGPRRRFRPAHKVMLAVSQRITRRPVVTVVGVLLASATMIVPAALFHASRTSAPVPTALPPVCRLQSCAGRDPRATACEDPKTLASHTAADGTRLDLRLSPGCRAGWIRARPTHANFRIEISSPGERPWSATATALTAAEDLVTTPMIAAPEPDRLQACYYPTAGRPGRECFGGP
ncbi:helix-turn-helix domain-containing protein [Streptomyces griseofuscus]|uniref:helix-turn-helix domain-containing protein n=1 Tax=Streptomyces griseofuscus TaxID=146922 RepID=UPI00380F31C4